MLTPKYKVFFELYKRKHAKGIIIINETKFLDIPKPLIFSIIIQFKFHTNIFNKKYFSKCLLVR